MLFQKKYGKFFDELTTNIEDRIWGQKVINPGYKIIYEPKASVFHWHEFIKIWIPKDVQML